MTYLELMLSSIRPICAWMEFECWMNTDESDSSIQYPNWYNINLWVEFNTGFKNHCQTTYFTGHHPTINGAVDLVWGQFAYTLPWS